MNTKDKIEESVYWEADSLLYKTILKSIVYPKVNQSTFEELVIERYYGWGPFNPLGNQISEITNYYSTITLQLIKTTQDDESDYYEYDENGLLTSVTEATQLKHRHGKESYQYDPQTGVLQTKTFVYKHDYPAITENYDPQGNIIGKRMGEHFERYEYTYDSVGNWLSRKRFDGATLKQYDIRKITYFEQPIPETVLPVPDKQFVEDIYQKASQFASICQQNHDKRVVYYNALENGEYDADFLITEANNIEDFTPKLWEIRTNIEADYDGDGVIDRVVVYDTPLVDTDEGYQRLLALFKQVDGKWMLHKTFRDLLPTRECWNCTAGGSDVFRGIGFGSGYIIIYEALEMGRGYESSTYYKYLTDEELATEGEGLYLMKRVSNSHDGPEAFYTDSTDYENGISIGDKTYEYENESDSPEGKNGTFPYSTVIKEKPKLMISN